MEYGTILVRTIVLYAIIVFVFRVMGKREIGQLGIVDFVVSIMIAELAVISIEDPKTPMLQSLIPIFLLLIIQVSLAIVSLKSEKFREIVDNKPSVLIKNGKIDENEMKKQRYNFDDLLVQLREKDVAKVSDVEFAILEPSGKLSVIEKNKGNNKQRKNVLYPQLRLPLAIILDGKVQEDHLGKINKSEFWLRQELRKLGFKEIKKISFCTIDENGTFFVDLKDEK
ncbi:hypothetical protein CIB95_05590 [Lottiidibacillus patelloidae]|uniref:YetF C-terminal domain-containing protein n=1 Tax=Lottiidibacillus patelloidae TaxID=2670334 RepID=A0A263BW97_9BACI|nr:DUF421 domain-containing protein [Lottiidibacillus patelloidae]OZM57832.1 hypothetical protein CIB95_05590 [Lottiidibacillus patelloidae]